MHDIVGGRVTVGMLRKVEIEDLLRRGEFVAMRGYLVNVGGPDGFYWNTSLRRDDTGNGACEVFYVESVEAKAVPALLAHAR